MHASASSKDRKRKVLIIPYYGPANPYLPLLASALEARDIQVSLSRRRGRVSLFRAVRAYGLPDILHLQWQHRFFVPRSGSLWGAVVSTLLFFLQWLVLRGLGVRFVWTVHNLVNHERVLAWWELPASRVLARAVDAIVVHCRAAVPLVAEAFRVSDECIQVIAHGNYMDSYPPARTRASARRELAIPEDLPVFLFFGQIREYKGLPRLLRAFADLPSESARLIIVGEPREETLKQSLLEEAARDSRVLLTLEHVEDDILVEYLSACDAVVLPYTDSLTSGAAILAASCGRPLILPALGCLKEFPTDAAVMYDPDEPGSLQSAMTRALGLDLDSMGESARRYAERLGWSEIGESWDRLYSSLTDHGARYD